MESYLLTGEEDTRSLREWIGRLPCGPSIVDFEEHLLIRSVRKTLRIWRHGGRVLGFAYVDEYDNLWFETEPGHDMLDELEGEIVAWGETCVRRRNAETGLENPLEHTCDAGNARRIHVMERHGFVRQAFRTLRFERRLDRPVEVHSLPAGFSIRRVEGALEVDSLVALHRAAFGTDRMTVEQRLALMAAPGYEPELDRVAVAPDGTLAAFCVGGFSDPERKIGFTDPIGVHPAFRGTGLGKALVSACLAGLREAGAVVAQLGTGSDNAAMTGLAASLGFVCASEKLWFSKPVFS